MSNVPSPSRGRILLTSFLIALAAGAAYVIAALVSGYDPLWTPLGAVIVVAVLTLVFYAVNWRRASRDAGSGSGR